MSRKRVLILFTGNACRSQMAQGFVNRLAADRWEAHSAGTSPADRVHLLAVRAMAEIGIDISAETPKHVDRFLRDPWDLVVTVCDSAKQSCPRFSGRVAKLHLSFADSALADGSEEARRGGFRRVRDQIGERLLAELEALRT